MKHAIAIFLGIVFGFGVMHKTWSVVEAQEPEPLVRLTSMAYVNCTPSGQPWQNKLLIVRASDKKLVALDHCKAAEDPKYATIQTGDTVK